MALVIRNTFVEVDESGHADAASTPLRRCNSVPHDMCLFKEVSVEDSCSKLDSKLERMSSGSDVSTNVTTMSSTSDNFEGSSACSWTMPMQDPTWGYAPMAQMMMMPQMGYTPLNSHAQVYCPQVCPPVQQVDPMEEFQKIASDAYNAVQSTGFVAATRISTSNFGWQIIAEVSPNLMDKKDEILSVAQAAILKGAEESSSSYVMGYRNTPFIVSPLGFSGLLGHVRDESKVCWAILQQGSCKFEGCCRYQHPEVRSTLGVMVVPAKSEEEAS
eukprot:TRINITY_DN40292_c0_g1_i1.p1 TRINITY_DN40292_c0_g1~~TRINITY_DN40292_c0_g1_i1.p1  ORF type:complete len:273 (+),score=57.65 TRINITY_DN40292_c0_g1_i1:343-1161(+)